MKANPLHTFAKVLSSHTVKEDPLERWIEKVAGVLGVQDRERKNPAPSVRPPPAPPLLPLQPRGQGYNSPCKRGRELASELVNEGAGNPPPSCPQSIWKQTSVSPPWVRSYMKTSFMKAIPLVRLGR